MCIANLRAISLIWIKAGFGHEIGLVECNHLGEDILCLTDHYLIGLWANLCDKYRMTHGEIQALSLANCIVGNSQMLTKNHAILGNKVTRPWNLTRDFSL